MTNNITIIISSNKKFAPVTLPVLTTSLFEAGFDASEIIIVCGGHIKRKVRTYRNIQYIEVEHNSFDLTSLIDAVEFKTIQTEYCYLLHDTCFVGLSFKPLIYQYNYAPTSRVKLYCGPSMNMGLYSLKFLLKHKEILIRMKNFDSTEKGIRDAKRKAVETEDIMFSLYDDGVPVGCFCKKIEHLTQPVSLIYKTENLVQERRQDYFPEIDLYKLKANFVIRQDYIVDL
jgi:hypothetical protein